MVELVYIVHHCNTSGVVNTKTCHVIICIAHHSCVSENFDMHTLKQVYFYVICDDLCGLNQVQNFCIGLDFQKTLNLVFKFTLENPFKNLSKFWG